MAQPNSDEHIVSTPAAGYQPYDAPSTEPCGDWRKLDSGEADIHTGRTRGADFASGDHWQQV